MAPSEVNKCSDAQEMPFIFLNLKVYSLLCLPWTLSGPCSELDESSHHPPILLTVKFNISLPSVSRSSGWFFGLKFPAKVCYRCLDRACYMPCLFHTL